MFLSRPSRSRCVLHLFFCGLTFQGVRCQNQNIPEVISHDAPTTFSTRVSLVTVPVVVRDRAGNAIGTLHKEDFNLFDKGRQQFISKFSVEKAGGAAIRLEASPSEISGGKATVLPADIAGRFVAYLFDDVNTPFSDLAPARDAARNQISQTLEPADRVAIFTTSGQTNLDFTADRKVIDDALLRLRARPKTGSVHDCPDVSYYMADLILNRNDRFALNAATLDAMACMNLPSNQRSSAEQSARGAASRALSAGDYETRLALNVLKDSIRRVSAMPGQRVLVLVSSGFLLLAEHRFDETDILDRAIRANVTINTLDARGLYAPPGLDASQRTSSVQAQMMKSQYQRETAQAEGEVLGEVADATGGTWFHNRNDLVQGFRLAAAAPEFTYLLGFAPQNLRYDGSFHALKVTLKTPNGLALQARRGYYAPKHQATQEEQAADEIREALFSRDEMKDIPVTLQTQYFKPTDINARLSVLAHVDLRAIHFRKADRRNRDSLVVLSGIFDRDGVLVSAIEKTIDMFLKDETFDAHVAAGLNVKTSFDVPPGNYMIRLVVRDNEGQAMTAQNGVVRIP